MDDLIPICRQDGGVLIGDTGCEMKRELEYWSDGVLGYWNQGPVNGC